MNKNDILEIVKTEIIKWDPIDLLQLGAPLNEYDMEISLITNRIEQGLDIKQIEYIIYKVFIYMFEESTFSDINKFKKECNNIATIIYNSLKLC